MIAALFVLPDGPYIGLPDVDPWPESRDARLYAGPWPVVAHPPCARWGNFHFGGPQWLKDGNPRKLLGDDGGCFAAAVAAVRRWGGVLEHPANSRAWVKFGLARPASRGWVRTLDGGWCTQVAQGNYGHRADKPTWLYVVGIDPLPRLIWGHSGKRAQIGGLSLERRRRLQRTGIVQALSRRQRSLTPIPFRDLLLDLARSVPQPAVVAP